MTVYLWKHILSPDGITKIGIDTIKVDENIKNNINIFPIGKGKTKQMPAFNYETKVIDLKQISRVVSVQGYLSAQSAVINKSNGTTTTSITATEAKNYIEKYIIGGAEPTGLYWRGSVEDWTDANPTESTNIANRVYWGEITTITFSEDSSRQDMSKGDYEAIKGSYSTYAYPGEVKRYKITFEFIVGTKR
jgi:hypothetical protein